jgi:ribosome-associated protein
MSAWKTWAVHEVTFEYTRSRGAGGQHVNRTETAVVLRFSVPQSQAFSEEEKQRLMSKLRLTNENELLIREESQRDRLMNRNLVIKKFLAVIEKALHVDKPRKKTKPTKSSQRKRVDGKRFNSEKKKLRGKVAND